MLDCTQV
ncbi:hypothetical protein V3C99_003050 [Haemonchus contortus]